MATRDDIVNLDGLTELTEKLSKLERKVAGQTIRRAMSKVTKPALDEMISLAPRGKVRDHHLTYDKLTVQKGFLKRSIKRRIRVDRRKGSIRAVFGVLRRAFYGINFLDQGPHDVTSRRVTGGKGLRFFRLANTRKRITDRRKRLGYYTAAARRIKPYRIRQLPTGGWFEQPFVRRQLKMVYDFRTILAQEVKKVMSNGRK